MPIFCNSYSIPTFNSDFLETLKQTPAAEFNRNPPGIFAKPFVTSTEYPVPKDRYGEISLFKKFARKSTKAGIKNL